MPRVLLRFRHGRSRARLRARVTPAKGWGSNEILSRQPGRTVTPPSHPAPRPPLPTCSDGRRATHDVDTRTCPPNAVRRAREELLRQQTVRCFAASETTLVPPKAVTTLGLSLLASARVAEVTHAGFVSRVEAPHRPAAGAEASASGKL